LRDPESSVEPPYELAASTLDLRAAAPGLITLTALPPVEVLIDSFPEDEDSLAPLFSAFYAPRKFSGNKYFMNMSMVR